MVMHPPKGGVNPMLYVGFLLPRSARAWCSTSGRPPNRSNDYRLAKHHACSPAYARAVADLRDCRDRLRLRHLRSADGAARRRSGDRRADRRQARARRNSTTGSASSSGCRRIVGGAFGLLGGYLTDWFGRRRVLVWSILLYAFSALAAGFATSVEMLLFLRSTTYHRRVRRVRRRRRLDRRALSRCEAARARARLHAGVLVDRRHHGRPAHTRWP